MNKTAIKLAEQYTVDIVGGPYRSDQSFGPAEASDLKDAFLAGWAAGQVDVDRLNKALIEIADYVGIDDSERRDVPVIREILKNELSR